MGSRGEGEQGGGEQRGGGAEGRASRGEGEQRGGGAEERTSEMINLVNLRPGFIEVVCVLDQQQHVILYLLQVSILTILLGGKEKIWKRKYGREKGEVLKSQSKVM